MNLPSHPHCFTLRVYVVLYSLTVFLITSSFSSSDLPSSFLFSLRLGSLCLAYLSCSSPYPSLPVSRTNVLIHLHPSCCFLFFFFPMSGLHNASGNPTPSSLSVLLSHSPTSTSFSASPLAHPALYPLNNNYSAILSAILYRKRKVRGRVKRTRRTRERDGWVDG